MLQARGCAWVTTWPRWSCSSSWPGCCPTSVSGPRTLLSHRPSTLSCVSFVASSHSPVSWSIGLPERLRCGLQYLKIHVVPGTPEGLRGRVEYLKSHVVTGLPKGYRKDFVAAAERPDKKRERKEMQEKRYIRITIKRTEFSF